MLDKSALSALTKLADTLTDPHDLDSALAMITTITCDLMETRQAAILLRDEDHHQLIVKALRSAGATSVQPGLPLKLPPRLHGILWKAKTTHRINDIQAGVRGLVFPILSTPLKICMANIAGKIHKVKFNRLLQKIKSIMWMLSAWKCRIGL